MDAYLGGKKKKGVFKSIEKDRKIPPYTAGGKVGSPAR